MAIGGCQSCAIALYLMVNPRSPAKKELTPWPYFAKEFGLKMDLFLEPKPGIPPTPAHLAQVIAEMKEKKIRVIIVQAYQNRKIAETVAGHTGAAALDFPLFPGYNQSYIDWIDSLVKSLSSTLNK